MAEQTVVRQGNVYWVDFGVPYGSETGYRRPVVVVQSDRINRSRLRTVTVCAVSGNLERLGVGGNVSLPQGEADLGYPCVAVVTQIETLDRRRCDDLIGTLSHARLAAVVTAVQSVFRLA